MAGFTASTPVVGIPGTASAPPGIYAPAPPQPPGVTAADLARILNTASTVPNTITPGIPNTSPLTAADFANPTAADNPNASFPYASPMMQRPVDPGVFGLPGFHAGVAGTASHPSAPIEHVIASLGIHPHSGLATAFRAIHSILTQHLASQAMHSAGSALGAVRPGPTLQ